MVITTLAFALVVALFTWTKRCSATLSCDTPAFGYQCKPTSSHFWGQYSPYFTVRSDIPDVLPAGCEISFAQVLSRHGARFPTSSKTKTYNATIQQLKSNVKKFSGRYKFLASYTYDLGADNLTAFGQREMANSGTKFYQRYVRLARKQTPFFRAASEYRVVQSAQNFSQGFRAAKSRDPRSSTEQYPYSILLLPEDEGFNNTLNHELCTAFESGPESEIGDAAQSNWIAIFVPPIQARLNDDLPGANLTLSQVISLMDLCPFGTVASPYGKPSEFCGLFSDREWREYDYYQSLGKFYGYGSGNPLGPTQGVGFTNELIARMTNSPVEDETTTNHTLDSSPDTFPIGNGQVLYADFSHDNGLSGHFAAMGLYNTTTPLPNTTYRSTDASQGYSAAWSVPFGARAYFEKMKCFGQDEELVRILVNDRIIPLQNCGADKLGRCKLSAWVESLSFARANGRWSECFE